MAHVKPGDPLDISAKSYNSWEDAADANERSKLGVARANQSFFLPPGAVMLKNSSGSNLVQGRVLEIGASLITTFDRRFPWFTGSTPAPDGTKGIAVTTLAMASNDTWWCMNSGIVLARVNINHEQQMWADVDSGSTLLQSKWYGRAEILKKESSGTGERNCWVRMGEMFRGPIKVIITQSGGIAPGSSGTAKVRVAGADASPTSTITVYYTWMEGAANAGQDKEAVVFWDDTEQKFIILELQC